MSQKNCYPSLRRNALRYMVSPNRSPTNENGVQFCVDFFAGLSSKGKLIFFLLLRFVDEKKKKKTQNAGLFAVTWCARTSTHLIVLQFVWVFANFFFLLLHIFPYIPYSIVATCKLYWFDCRTSFPSFIFYIPQNICIRKIPSCRLPQRWRLIILFCLLSACSSSFWMFYLRNTSTSLSLAAAAAADYRTVNLYGHHLLAKNGKCVYTIYT